MSRPRIDNAGTASRVNVTLDPATLDLIERSKRRNPDLMSISAVIRHALRIADEVESKTKAKN